MNTSLAYNAFPEAGRLRHEAATGRSRVETYQAELIRLRLKANFRLLLKSLLGSSLNLAR